VDNLDDDIPNWQGKFNIGLKDPLRPKAFLPRYVKGLFFSGTILIPFNQNI
jgi:hypothetical protein